MNIFLLTDGTNITVRRPKKKHESGIANMKEEELQNIGSPVVLPLNVTNVPYLV